MTVIINSTTYEDVAFATTQIDGVSAIVLTFPYSDIDMDTLATELEEITSAITVGEDTYSGYTVFKGFEFDGSYVKATITKKSVSEQLSDLADQIEELQTLLADTYTTTDEDTTTTDDDNTSK